MKAQITVSVLMPVYNGGAYLSKAIDSIIAQTYTDWELILIDDGSTDGSAHIISGYTDDRIRTIQNDVNIGLIATLNKGIDLCRGKYIARMDADDIALPSRLEAQVTFMEDNLDYILCGSNVNVIDNGGNISGKILNFSNPELLKIHLLFSVPLVHPTIFFRSNVLHENKYNAGYKHVEDYELWTRLAKIGKMTNLQDILLSYRWHDSNVSVTNADYQKKQKENIIIESLSNLGIVPSEDELAYHVLTFGLSKRDGEGIIDEYTVRGVEAWFGQLIEANRIRQIYDQSYFIAFLWSRWIVLCTATHLNKRMFFPQFASYRPKVLFVLAEIIFLLKKK